MWQKKKYALVVPKNLGVGLEWELIFGCAVKAISSLGVRSPWADESTYEIPKLRWIDYSCLDSFSLYPISKDHSLCLSPCLYIPGTHSLSLA